MWYQEQNYGVMVKEIRPGFDIIENDTGDFLITISHLPGVAHAPMLIVSGSMNKAVFRFNKSQIMNLSEIDTYTIQKLRQAHRILIAEVDDDKITKSYHVPVTLGNL